VLAFYEGELGRDTFSLSKTPSGIIPLSQVFRFLNATAKFVINNEKERVNGLVVANPNVVEGYEVFALENNTLDVIFDHLPEEIVVKVVPRVGPRPPQENGIVSIS
jgi:hypothetical protein